MTPLVAVFQTNPQITKPVTYGSSNTRYQASVIIHGICIRMRAIGAQGTTLLYGDLYNSIRCRLHISGSTFADAPDSLGGGVDLWYDTGDVVRMLYDHLFDLPSTAYNSASGYNVPNVRSDGVYIPLGMRFDFFSLGASAAGNWDSRKNDIVLTYVSDSSATPHPVLQSSIRLYYDIVQ